MKKRPGLLEGLEADQKRAEVQTAIAEVHHINPLQVKIKNDVHRTSIYIPKAAHKKLRDIAHAQNCKVHDLLMQGVSHVLADHGYPTLEELVKK